LYDGILEPFLKPIKKKVASLAAQSDLFPVLDICCGTGRQCCWMAFKGGPVFGLDINFKLMRYASSRYPGPLFICADAAHLPFPDSAFRGMTISFALHEKSPKIRPLILAEAKRVLAPGGRIILVDFEKPWNKKSQRASAYTRLIEAVGGKRHLRNSRDFLERGGLRGLIKENGLREVERYDIEAGALGIVEAEFKS
jgi:ubiquinone/menaquinone biosynthesis C-methylase UbiE